MIMKNAAISRRFSFTVLLLLSGLTPAALFADRETDRKIKDAAESSYNFRAVLDNNVTAKVNDGVVTLSGTVLDPEQKSLAEETARNLPGVNDVKNELEITSPGPDRADGWIALKLKSILLVRANVSAKHTDVTVRDGVVTLDGTAASVAQKELTAAYARDVEGVKSVQNNLKVVPPGSSATGASVAGTSGVGEKIDDGSITAQVKYALLRHPATSALKASVQTRDGRVLIRGEADTAAEKDLVSKLAHSVRGVAAVANEMSVRSAAAE